ncbi:Uncharacterized protein SVXHr_2647 [Halorhabdus sp. SVX81]|uniref:hypothetical protein n=1 Tax=Halorhabdus sp. SVX81 TaxID=2978283 RepID=UPI0023DBFB43|nr:hypothetical protein [Halorhabdus sp. SVX81]WEL18791.1 Uncharacterized protein SVXHr_2647 [Halorhabdus sp. SVX81]
MVALTFKASLRHWARLFGYFLAVAVAGGAVAGGGLVLLRDVPGWMPGGRAPDVGVKLLAGAGLLAVGALVLLAGFFMIVLAIVADGVRVGIEAASLEPAGEDGTDDGPAEQPVSDPAERNRARRRAGRAPVGGQPHRPQRDRTRAQPTAESTSERRAPTEPDEEHWIREVERDLEGEEGPEEARRASSGAPPAEGAEPTSQPPDRRATSEEEPVESPASERDRSRTETDGAPPADRDESGDDEWVSGSAIDASESTREVESADTTGAVETDVSPPTDTAAVDAPVTDVTGDTDTSEDDNAIPESADGSDPAPEADDPLAPDDFEPEAPADEPADTAEERDETTGASSDAAVESADSVPDSTDSDDEQG